MLKTTESHLNQRDIQEVIRWINLFISVYAILFIIDWVSFELQKIRSVQVKSSNADW